MGVLRNLAKLGGGATLGAGAVFGAVHFATETDLETTVKTEHPLTPPNLFSRQLVTLVVTAIGRLYNAALLDVRVDGHDEFRRAWGERHPRRGLLTLCNHASTVDEPLVVPCSLLDVGQCFYGRGLMWSATAVDVMYTSRATAWLSSSAQALPIVRGGGVGQRSMDALVAHLVDGEWVNFYPEGRVVQNEDGSLGNLRRGLTRLICEPAETPIVLPILSDGLDRVMPLVGWPRIFTRVRVRVGAPLELGPLIERMRARGVPEEELRTEIGRIVEETLRIEQRALRAAVLADPLPWWSEWLGEKAVHTRVSRELSDTERLAGAAIQAASEEAAEAMAASVSPSGNGSARNGGGGGRRGSRGGGGIGSGSSGSSSGSSGAFVKADPPSESTILPPADNKTATVNKETATKNDGSDK
jgi:monolysocardiolipin acyltransferase